MSVVFDAGFLIRLLDDDPAIPINPDTQEPISDIRERIDLLVQHLEQQRERVLIPTPALAEYLQGAGRAGPELHAMIKSLPVFQIAPFDEMAAVEYAAVAEAARASGAKSGPSSAEWQRVKFDRQIAAIGKVCGANTIYTGDGNLAATATEFGLRAVRFHQLPAPERPPQSDFFLDGPKD